MLAQRWLVLLPTALQYYEKQPKSLTDEPLGTVKFGPNTKLIEATSDPAPFSFFVDPKCGGQRVYEFRYATDQRSAAQRRGTDGAGRGGEGRRFFLLLLLS